MKSAVARFVISSLLLPAAISWADFKYSETTKTGGAMAGMVKFASFGQRSRQPAVAEHEVCQGEPYAD